MKPDELPEDINNPKPQESAEVTPPIPSSLSDSSRTSDNAEELFIPQDAATPEQVPISEPEIATRLESPSLPPAAPETRQVEPEENPPSITQPATDIFVSEQVPIIESEIATRLESPSLPATAPETRRVEPEENLPLITQPATDIFVASNKPLQQRISLAGKMPTPQEFLEKSNRAQISKQEEESQESRENLPKEDAPMRIFITGGSGCIGHYIVETLIEKTDYELFLLVRNPNKLKFDANARPGIHIVQGDMREIKRFGKLLKTMNCAVLAAAGWGGQEAIDVNVFKTIELLNLLDPKLCQHVIYFSTASVLNRQNQLLKEAGQAGTDYIRSKYDFLRQVNRVPIAGRITTVFPTLVLGGDDKHPYSHVSGGLPDLMKETEILRFLDKPLLKVKPIDLIRFFQADGSFHFIHARDIAQVVRYLIDHPPESQDSRWLVLGNEPVTINEVIEEACAYLNKPITRRFNLSPWLADILIRLFRIQMSAWDRFSFEYRHFTYQNPVNPSTFGMPVYCPELIDVLKQSGILPRE